MLGGKLLKFTNFFGISHFLVAKLIYFSLELHYFTLVIDFEAMTVLSRSLKQLLVVLDTVFVGLVEVLDGVALGV